MNALLKKLLAVLEDGSFWETRALPAVVAFAAGLLVAGVAQDARVERELEANARVLREHFEAEVAQAVEREAQAHVLEISARFEVEVERAAAVLCMLEETVPASEPALLQLVSADAEGVQ